MSIKILLPFISILFTTFSNSQTLNTNNKNFSNLERNIDSVVKPHIENGEIGGCVVGIAQNGSILFTKSYGYSDLKNEKQLNAKEIFPIASVSKTFTAIAIMQLVEEKKIKLNENVSNYINFDTQENSVTIFQLLNHTSGIKDYTETGILQNLKRENFSSTRLLNEIEKLEYDFKPGTQMDYNNSGYFLLAMIIESVSGLTYEEYLRKNIFEPLNMSNTSNCYARPDSSITKGYNTTKDGKLKSIGTQDYRLAMGAGSLCSNVSDLLKWQIALHHSKKLLNQQAYSKMTSRNKLENGGKTNYGLGLEINNHQGNQVISHNGVIEGYLSDTRFFPSDTLSIVVLSNTLGKIKPTNLSNKISEFFLKEKHITETFKGNLSNYSGIYKGKVMGHEIMMELIQENGMAAIKSRGNKSFLRYIGGNTWLAEDGYTYYLKNDIMQVNSPKLSIIFNKIE